MPVSLTCSGCSATMKAPDSMIGKRVACPKCKTSFVIPDPNAVNDFEVVEEILEVAEVIETDLPAAPPVAPVAKPAKPAAQANAAHSVSPSSTINGKKVKKPNPRFKKKVDATDYLTRVNGKPLALKPGETEPPTSLPRRSAPRD